MSDDLSEFERRRLENIQRNEAFLASLNLTNIKAALDTDLQNKAKKEAYQKRKRESNPTDTVQAERKQPTRYSKRLRSQDTVVEDKLEQVNFTLYMFRVKLFIVAFLRTLSLKRRKILMNLLLITRRTLR